MAGKTVAERQFQRWADEAKAGYDVEALKRRGYGRPGRGAESTHVTAVCLTAEEVEVLDAHAGREHGSRSEMIRQALADYVSGILDGDAMTPQARSISGPPAHEGES